MTLSLFEDEAPIEIINSDGVVTCWQQLLSEHEANALFDELLTAPIWQQESIQLYGKRLLQPRLTAWYGDYGVSAEGGYEKLYQTVDFTPRLLLLKAEIERLTGYRFNCVLANLYRDGRDSVGYHADNEKILGVNPVIASYSLGATRRFLLKHNRDKSQKIGCNLEHNSLLYPLPIKMLYSVIISDTKARRSMMIMASPYRILQRRISFRDDDPQGKL